MKHLFLCLSILLSTMTIHGQVAIRETIGGPGDNRAYSVANTSDGGYVLCGYTDNQLGSNNYNLYVVKLTSSGQVEWTKVYDSLSSAKAIIQTNDGGYAVVTDHYNAILKLDNAGNVQWFKKVSGEDNDSEAYDLVQTSDGGYALCGVDRRPGNMSNDVYVVKLDVNGDIQWARSIGGDYDERAESIIQTSDGGYAVAGHSFSFSNTFGYPSFYIVKLSSSGALEWTKSIGKITEEASEIIQTTDGGYAVSGKTGSFSTINTWDMYLVRLDNNGNLLWDKNIYRHPQYSMDMAYSVVQSIDGGFSICGMTKDFGSHNGLLLVKLNGSGALEWSSLVNQDQFTEGRSMVRTSDGGFAVAGFTPVGAYTKMFFAKFDSEGRICGDYDSTDVYVTEADGIENNGGAVTSTIGTLEILYPGTGHSGGTLYQMCFTLGVNIAETGITTSLQPNPFSDYAIINFGRKVSEASLTLYNSLAQPVKRVLHIEGTTFKVDRGNLPAGAYIVEIIERNRVVLRTAVSVIN